MVPFHRATRYRPFRTVLAHGQSTAEVRRSGVTNLSDGRRVDGEVRVVGENALEGEGREDGDRKDSSEHLGRDCTREWKGARARD